MNEPDTDYWGYGSPKQEGCHFDPGASQSKMITETRKALDNAGFTDVLVAGMDETSLKKTANNLGSLTDEARLHSAELILTHIQTVAITHRLRQRHLNSAKTYGRVKLTRAVTVQLLQV